MLELASKLASAVEGCRRLASELAAPLAAAVFAPASAGAKTSSLGCGNHDRRVALISVVS
jgi:hypothetical protein